MKILPCQHCGAPFPHLTLSVEDIARAVSAFRDSGTSLAKAEIRAAANCEPGEAALWLAHRQACHASWTFYADDQRVLTAVNQAFMDVAKPEHFTNFTHCGECKEHDDTLRLNTRETISLEAIGNSGWDPMNFSSADGIAYYFPAMARFSLLDQSFSNAGWYGDQLIWHLSRDGFLYEWCNDSQRAAVHTLLRHLLTARRELLVRHSCVEEVKAALDQWSKGQAHSDDSTHQTPHGY